MQSSLPRRQRARPGGASRSAERRTAWPGGANRPTRRPSVPYG